MDPKVYGPDSRMFHHSCWSCIKWSSLLIKITDRIYLNRHIAPLRVKTLAGEKIRNLILIKSFIGANQDRTLRAIL